MLKKIVCLLFAFFISAAAGCTPTENVSVDGSTSMNKVIGMLAESFENETGISVTFNATGSGAGIQAVMDGRCEIGLSSRALTKNELSKGLNATVLAYDGIALIVNPKNPIENLSMSDVQKIFTGEITNWSALGGADSQIVLIGRESGSGTRDGFESVTDTVGKCRYRQELTSSGDVITAVSGNANAIGYTSLTSVKERAKILSIDGIFPTEETIRNENYRLQRPFVLVTSQKTPLSENAEIFLSYITSKDAHEFIYRAGVVPAS